MSLPSLEGPDRWHGWEYPLDAVCPTGPSGPEHALLSPLQCASRDVQLWVEDDKRRWEDLVGLLRALRREVATQEPFTHTVPVPPVVWAGWNAACAAVHNACVVECVGCYKAPHVELRHEFCLVVRQLLSPRVSPVVSLVPHESSVHILPVLAKFADMAVVVWRQHSMARPQDWQIVTAAMDATWCLLRFVPMHLDAGMEEGKRLAVRLRSCCTLSVDLTAQEVGMFADMVADLHPHDVDKCWRALVPLTDRAVCLRNPETSAKVVAAWWCLADASLETCSVGVLGGLLDALLVGTTVAPRKPCVAGVLFELDRSVPALPVASFTAAARLVTGLLCILAARFRPTAHGKGTASAYLIRALRALASAASAGPPSDGGVDGVWELFHWQGRLAPLVQELCGKFMVPFAPEWAARPASSGDEMHD